MSAPQTGVEPVVSPPMAIQNGLSHELPTRLIFSLAVILIALWGGVTYLPWHIDGTVFSVSIHTITEFGAIVAALLVFSVAWHARSPGQPGNIVIIGCGFLAVGLIDFGHTLSFKGMPDFVTPSSPEKAIEFWLMARYTAAWTMLVAAIRPIQPLHSGWPRYALLALALVWTAAMYAIELMAPGFWPRTFVEGKGLTAFKILAEYGVMALAALAAFVFMRRKSADLAYSTNDLCAAAIITVLSEACLTMYGSVNDVFILLGHLYKVVAYYFIYRAVFITSVRDPYRRLSEEIEERQEAEQRAAFLAYHDVLTSLPNRELARDRLLQALADAKRHQKQVAMVLLDLDHFKNINDTLGHAVGDQLLQAVADILTRTLRQTDTVSRPGGDEFLMILKDLHDADAAAPVVTKLIEELSKPIEIEGQELSISASIGIAMAPNDGEDFEILLQRADTAMYRSKEEGRNTYRFFDDRMNAESVEKLSMRNGLRRALELKQFVLHYQPQVDLATGRVFGAEALIRWQHPEWGLVPPGKFIPVAEESGLIVPIGDWVIEEACRQAKAWVDRGYPPLTVAVNLSALQFKRGEVEQVVSQALATSGLPAHQLELELTESVLISDVESVERRLKALKALGVKLAIDDFGTGYSSLSYLKRFSVDKLKIDQSFVRDLERHPDEVAIVRAIIQMAAGLGLSSIAEGVETLGMMQNLRSLGCDEGQGYWFAKPMPAAAFEDWLIQTLDHGTLARVTEAA
ncbi:MAG: EAL domain-containing protein [Aquabacterium sp.]|uniref:bifunctional diguanylate cyclase/phosphodiesterase n=1 Tax=Aquabacterium sp. TaxID=1872578 RepID=UPI0025B804C6|nr:EAL domain-containing protein [Aquabacterium sp.]MBI5925310.1 EAL domain-containing protein [Aquabacterium sp.]